MKWHLGRDIPILTYLYPSLERPVETIASAGKTHKQANKFQITIVTQEGKSRIRHISAKTSEEKQEFHLFL